MLLLFIVVLLVAAGAAVLFQDQWLPNRQHVQAEFADLAKPVFYQGDYFPVGAIGEKDSLKLPLELVQKWIDPAVIYEESSDSVIITTKDKVLRFQTSQLSAYMNEKPFTLNFPVEKKAGVVYVPIEPLRQLYPIDLRESDVNGAVLLVKQGEKLQWARQIDKDGAVMRTGATLQAPIVSALAAQERVIVWEEAGDWYKVQQTTGYIGFVHKKRLLLEPEPETVPKTAAAPDFVPWKPQSGGKLNVTWEHVVSKNPDTAKIPAMPGLNVVSPTWFSLADEKGNIKNLADAAYAKWAHNRGYQVWALFSNGFEPDRTAAALATYDTRINIIKQLLGFAKVYNLQGINIDFENVYLKNKDDLVQFVREMTPLMHEQGLVVSIDVTPKSTNEMWSLFYDRPALSQIVDYMMIMTYDEYWATSPKAGSVSSLPWMENSVRRLLDTDKVPASKLVLGIPFYTRQWTEETKNGKTTVSSKTLSMEGAQAIIKEKKLTPVFAPEAGQNYVEYEESGKLIRIWLEDDTSMKARIALANKYNLAGIATWRRGFEQPAIWDVIQKALSVSPF
ncbi:SH3 domain-containing protein [Paenibacillus athensensis]|uniref:Glycosyl hydrolase n=2 Tax=Paenibacillus athensensis TaxID=1967502 RepID=A0A4Y8Q001_9BACL|nr:SH3 domain-containing protein [Paenibacillus athensensis]